MKLKDAFQNIILSFITIAVCLAAFELYLRVFNKISTLAYICNPLIGATFAPDKKMKSVGREYCVDVETNSLGFRDKEWQISKPPGVFRVVVLGDSFMAGLQVPFKNLFTARLEAKLNAVSSKKRFEVLNFGMPEMGTVQEYETLKHYAISYHPDLVILAVFLQNDIRNNMPELDNYNYKPYYRLNEADELVLIPFKPPKELSDKYRKFVKDHFCLASYFSERTRRNPRLERFFIKIGLLTDIYNVCPKVDDIPASFYVYEQDYQPNWNIAWKITFKTIIKIKELCGENKAKFFLVSIPAKSAAEDRNCEYIIPHPKMKKYNWDFLKPYRLLNNFCETQDISYVDLLDPFKGHFRRSRAPLYFEYDWHFNSEGLELAAEIVSKKLIDGKLVPLGP